MMRNKSRQHHLRSHQFNLYSLGQRLNTLSFSKKSCALLRLRRKEKVYQDGKRSLDRSTLTSRLTIVFMSLGMMPFNQKFKTSSIHLTKREGLANKSLGSWSNLTYYSLTSTGRSTIRRSKDWSSVTTPSILTKSYMRTCFCTKIKKRQTKQGKTLNK